MNLIGKTGLTVIIAAALGCAGSLPSRSEEAAKLATPQNKVRRLYSRTVVLSKPPISIPEPEEEVTPAIKRHESLPETDEYLPVPILSPPALRGLPAAPRKKSDKTENWVLPPAPADLERSSKPVQRGWGWLADSVLELNQQTEDQWEMEEQAEQDESVQPPLLSPAGLHGEGPGPADITDVTGLPEAFHPVSELGFLPEVRVTNGTSLIGGAGDLARESQAAPVPQAGGTESENRRFNQMLQSELQADIQQDVSDSLPYPAARIPPSRPRLSATEEMLRETKVTLFGQKMMEPEKTAARLPDFRPTGDLQPSAFSQFTRYEPASEPQLFKEAPSLAVPRSAASSTESAAFSAGGLMFHRSSLTPGLDVTPPYGRITSGPLAQPGRLPKDKEDSFSPLRPSSGSKLIDRFLNLPQPEY